MIKTKYMFSKAKDTTSEAKAKDLAPSKDLAPKAKDMTSCPRGASRPKPWPRGLHLWLYCALSCVTQVCLVSFAIAFSPYELLIVVSCCVCCVYLSVSVSNCWFTVYFVIIQSWVVESVSQLKQLYCAVCQRWSESEVHCTSESQFICSAGAVVDEFIMNNEE